MNRWICLQLLVYCVLPASSSKRGSYAISPYTSSSTINYPLRRRDRNYGRNSSYSCLSYTSAEDTRRTLIWNSSILMRIIVKALQLASYRPSSYLSARKLQREEILPGAYRGLRVPYKPVSLWYAASRMDCYSKASRTYVWYSAHISPCRL
jgi:hypothetical protein